MPWSGYIDILGTRDAARTSPQDLQVLLLKFHAALGDFIGDFDGDCYGFSDGAFFSCEEFESFQCFLVKIRNQLFQASTYFRCSYLPGEIKVDPGESGLAKPGRVFVSYNFSGVAPDAYQAESTFKGVGCVIDVRRQRHPALQKSLEDAKDQSDKDRISKQIQVLEKSFDLARRRHLVDSFYIVQVMRRTTAISCVDFRYSDIEIGDDDDQIIGPDDNQQRLVDPLISSCYSALARSSKIASYYLSALVSMVRCCDLKKADWDEANSAWISTPYIFRDLMSDSSLRLLRDVPGFHLLLLASFDHLHRRKQEGGMTPLVEYRVLQHLLKVGACFRDLDAVPEFVITPAARRTLIDLKLRDARTDKRKGRKVKAVGN